MKCLNPHCQKDLADDLDGGARGLCGACYQSAKRVIDEGKTSWHLLIEQGKATESTFDKARLTRAWLLERNK